MKRYEAIIIGFGKGGKTLAAVLASHGREVAIIEQSKLMYGGTCINVGCIPTKALAHHSKQLQMKELATFEQKAAEYRKIIAKKEQLTAALRGKNFENLDSKENVTVFTGKAVFAGPHEVEIDSGEGTETIYGDSIYINTGSTTMIPDIPGIHDSRNVHTSTTLMELTELPRRMIILGAGYIGLEFASIYAGFGTQVTMLDTHPDLIPREDRDIAKAVQDTLEQKGIEFKLSVNIQSVQDVEQGVAVTYTDAEDKPHQLYADAVLIAAGRKPNTESLQLQKAGVEVTAKGAVKVNDRLQSTVPHIFAMGDVVGGLQFTYISLDDQRIIVDNLLGKKQRTTEDRINVPYSVFIDPPLSHVGLSEAVAREQGYEVKIAVMKAAAIPKAKLTEETSGVLKAIVDAKTNKILGCTLFFAESHEVINTVQIAIETGQEYTFLRDHIFTHPTMSESLNDLFQLI